MFWINFETFGKFRIFFSPSKFLMGILNYFCPLWSLSGCREGRWVGAWKNSHWPQIHPKLNLSNFSFLCMKYTRFGNFKLKSSQNPYKNIYFYNYIFLQLYIFTTIYFTTKIVKNSRNKCGMGVQAPVECQTEDWPYFANWGTPSPPR